MRIAVGQLWQETNTFNPNPTTWSDFENWGVAEGQEVVERYGETGELGGFLSRWSENRSSTNDELVGLARFVCWPWGRVESSTWSIWSSDESAITFAGISSPTTMRRSLIVRKLM